MQMREFEHGDLCAVLRLYAQARAFMAENGNPQQWGDDYPPLALLEQDIAERRGFVCLDGPEIVGVFYFRVGPDPTYGYIEGGCWRSDAPYGVVHRLASAAGRKGVASLCLAWCFQQCGNIRIDTHRDNFPMQNLLRKNGFERCGIIYLENGDDRIAFQKVK